jgi:hypothetical protein
LAERRELASRCRESDQVIANEWDDVAVVNRDLAQLLPHNWRPASVIAETGTVATTV